MLFEIKYEIHTTPQIPNPRKSRTANPKCRGVSHRKSQVPRSRKSYKDLEISIASIHSGLGF